MLLCNSFANGTTVSPISITLQNVRKPPFLYPLKVPQNRRLSDVCRGYGNEGFLPFFAAIIVEKTFISFFEVFHSDVKKNWILANRSIRTKDLTL